MSNFEIFEGLSPEGLRGMDLTPRGVFFLDGRYEGAISIHPPETLPSRAPIHDADELNLNLGE